MANHAVKYKTIVGTLSDEIMAGRYRRPMSFPSVARIVRRFNVAYQTAVKVLDELKQRGLVRTRQGAGTYVTAAASRTFGLLVPSWPTGDFFPALCHSVSSLCQSKGRPLLFADTSSISGDDMAARLSETARSFVQQRVSGVIFHPIDFRDGAAELNRSVAEVFRKAGIPLVLIDCDMAAPPSASGFDVIGIDNVAAGWQLGEHVLSRGARKILFVSLFQEYSSNVQLRCAGVCNAVAAKSDAIFLGSLPLSDGRNTDASILRLRPDAIICSSDTVAVQLLKRLNGLGLRVPADVMVTGVNDMPFAALTTPTLTTIHQPCFEIARAAFETLEARLANPDATPRHIFLPAPLVARESTESRIRQKNKPVRQKPSKKGTS